MTADELASLSEHAARIIASGGGLKALAQLLADTAHGAVLVEDEQWRHLAAADIRTRGDAASKIPASFAPYFRKSKNSISRAQIGDALTGICARMVAAGENGESPGYVTLFLRGKPASQAGAALRIIASAAGVECLRRGAGRAQQRRAFWERYFAGEFSDVATLRDDATAAGVALPSSFVTAVFDVEGATPHDALDAIASAVAPAGGSCPMALAGGLVVALFAVRNLADVARARQAAANAVRDVPQGAAARSVTCGVGAYHADLLAAPESLAQARQALAMGRRLYGRGTVTVHADLGFYALLESGGDRHAFEAFADSLIEPLAVYDRKHKTDLLMTLRLYFECGENVKEAAEKLSVHRHTIFYRLNQIAQILKVDLRSPKDQLGLRAALAIRQMREEA